MSLSGLRGRAPAALIMPMTLCLRSISSSSVFILSSVSKESCAFNPFSNSCRDVDGLEFEPVVGVVDKVDVRNMAEDARRKEAEIVFELDFFLEAEFVEEEEGRYLLRPIEGAGDDDDVGKVLFTALPSNGRL